MYINFTPFNYPYNKQPIFASKNKDVRKVDDIVRNSKNTFVMLPSSSYMAKFYKIVDTPQKKIDKLKLDSYEKKFLKIRSAKFFDKEANLTKNDFTPYIMEVLKLIKEEKFGNCCEKAIVALAALYANGHDESIAAVLDASVQVTDTKTGEIIFEKTYDLDHTVVLTLSNSEIIKSVENCIVVDPWLNYTANMTDAIAKYKSIFDSEIKYISYKIEDACIEKAKQNNETYNPDIYNISLRFVFDPVIIPPGVVKKEFIKEVSKTYPELKLSN